MENISFISGTNTFSIYVPGENSVENRIKDGVEIVEDSWHHEQHMLESLKPRGPTEFELESDQDRIRCQIRGPTETGKCEHVLLSGGESYWGI